MLQKRQNFQLRAILIGWRQYKFPALQSSIDYILLHYRLWPRGISNCAHTNEREWVKNLKSHSKIDLRGGTSIGPRGEAKETSNHILSPDTMLNWNSSGGSSRWLLKKPSQFFESLFVILVDVVVKSSSKTMYNCG